MQIPLANIHWRFLLVRDDWGFQVNPLCRHDIASPFPPSGNEGYVRNRDVLWATCNEKNKHNNESSNLVATFSYKILQ